MPKHTSLKAAAGQCPVADPGVTSGTADFGRYGVNAIKLSVTCRQSKERNYESRKSSRKLPSRTERRDLIRGNLHDS